MNLFDTFLSPELAVIHQVISEKTTDPAVPIIVERELEVELTIRGSEHLFEHETLENFDGLPEDIVQFTITANTIFPKLIADVDGRGSIENPRHIEIDSDLIEITNFLHRESQRSHIC